MAYPDAPTNEERALVARAETRRLALQGENSQLRTRYEEVMQWVNPPWDGVSRQLDPRPQLATGDRLGRGKMHVDIVGEAVNRWAVLEVGAAPVLRTIPPHVPTPLPVEDPAEQATERKLYDIDREIAQSQASQMEDVMSEWAEDANLHRTLLWGAWAKNAFGKSVLRVGWHPTERRPTCEVLENPSQVYYGYDRRYGDRALSWVIVADQMAPEEVNARFGMTLPLDPGGYVDMARWTGALETTDMDNRPEQQESNNRYVWVMEYWEVDRTDEDHPFVVRSAFIVANRVVESSEYEFLKRLPFHILEDSHVPTYMHGRSVAERAIPINAAYDDMLDRQSDVIEFESGPRYKGLNMANSGDEVDIPDPFHMVPLREGEDIQQIDTRVDFFPTQLHANELREAKYIATGLTPIAWGMSPNAQTSGRALSAEWRAVELPLAAKLINLGPEVRDIIRTWWDFAEQYEPRFKQLAKGYRRFKVVWAPLDIRDATERTLDVIQRLNANLLDPELAMEETGIENTSEVMARVRSYLVDPIWNPLRYQQLLVLKQLAIQIQQAELELGAMQQQAGPPPAEAAAMGEQAAAQGAQAPGGGATEAMNQPGATPGTGGLPLDVGILSRTPMEGGVGNQIIVNPQLQGGPPPAAGQQPQ